MTIQEALGSLAHLPFLYWQIAMVIVGLGLARRWMAWDRHGRGTLAELALVGISLTILLANTIAGLFSFARFNGMVPYLAAATLSLLLVYWRRRAAMMEDTGLILNIPNALTAGGRLAVLGIVALGVPLLLGAMRPVDEVDSVLALDFVIRWVDNAATPYSRAWEYVPFWELAYVPGLVLTRSDAFFWMASLMPVVIVSLGTYAVGRRLSLSKRLCLLLALDVAALYHFWIGPSGISTLKNDMIVAAGSVLVVLGGLKVLGGEDRGFLMSVVGFVFLSTKFSGLIIGAGGLSLTLALFVLRYRFLPRSLLNWCLLGLVVFLATTGHYYLHNAFVHGNPFYPISLDIFGIHLPGRNVLVGTSIMESFGDRRVWQAFFLPPSGISPAGYLFPPILAATLLASTVFCLRGLYQFTLRRSLADSGAFLLAAFIILSWLVYFRSFWSASHKPGDLFYLTNLYSLRYAEGTVALSEVFLCTLLIRAGFPEKAAFLATGLNLASRLAILYFGQGGWQHRVGDASLLIGLTAVAILVAAVTFHRVLAWSRPAILVMAIVGFTFVLGPVIIESNRLRWAPWWGEVWKPLYDARPSRIFILYHPDDPHDWPMRYLVAGRRFRHELTVGTQQDLSNLSTTEPARPDFVLRLRYPSIPFNSSTVAELTEKISERNYLLVSSGDFSLVFQATGKGMPLSEVLDRGRVQAWWLNDTPVGTLLPGGKVDAGGIDPRQHVLEDGELVLFGTRAQVALLDGRRPRIVGGEAGSALFVANLGLPGNGQARGLKVVRERNHWIPETAIPPRNQDPTLRTVRGGDASGPPWEIASSTGGFDVRQLSDDEGPFVRITATRDADWLVVIGRLPRDTRDQSPITVRARYRSVGTANVSLHIFDFDERGQARFAERVATPVGKWDQMRLWMRVKFWSPRDYYALGLLKPRRGDSIDVRELSLYVGTVP